MNYLKIVSSAAIIFWTQLPLASQADFYTTSFLELSANQKQLIETDQVEPSENFYRLYDRHNIQVDNTLAKVRTTQIERFHNASDIQDYGQYSISINPETQQLNLLRALSVAVDGTIISASAEDIKVIDSSSYNVFSSQKEILINIPALETGGYAVIDYTITTQKNKLEADWLQVFYPQVLIRKKQYELSASWRDDYSPSLFIESDAVVCTSTTHSLECKGRDIPALTRDSKVRWRDEIGYIHISDKSSWQQIVDDYSTLFHGALTPNDSDLLSEIKINENATTEEKISVIHQYVAQNIRYLSRSEYGNAFIPHNTKETLNKKQGDCKDKSALLVDLLRRIGVNAYPVLVSTHRKKLRDKIAPSISQFNHVVVCFDLPDQAREQPYCIDATDINTPWQHTPSWIQGNFALHLNAASPSLIHSDQYRWKLDVNTQLKFLKNGGQTENQKRVYHSQYAAWLKDYINRTEPTEVDRWLIEDYEKTVSDLATPAITFSGQKSMDTPIIIESTTEFSPFINIDDSLDYSEKDSWLIAELNENLLSNKIYDEHFSGVQLTSKIDIDLQNIWTVTIPPADLKLNHPYGSAKRTSTITPSGLQIATTVEIPSRWVKKDDIEGFNKFINALSKELNVQLYGDRVPPN